MSPPRPLGETATIHPSAMLTPYNHCSRGKRSMTQSQSTFEAPTTPEPRVPPSLRRYLTRRRNKLTKTLLRPGHGGVTLARKHSRAADEMLRDLFTLRSEERRVGKGWRSRW